MMRSSRRSVGFACAQQGAPPYSIIEDNRKEVDMYFQGTARSSYERELEYPSQYASINIRMHRYIGREMSDPPCRTYEDNSFVPIRP